IELVLDGLGELLEALREAALGLGREEALQGVPRRNGELGEVELAEIERYIALAPDAHRVRGGLGEAHLREDSVHLLGGPYAQLIGRMLEPARIGERLAGLDAHQHLVGARILSVEVVAIAGGDERDSAGLGELSVCAVDGVLLGIAVRLDLEEIRAGLEDL